MVIRLVDIMRMPRYTLYRESVRVLMYNFLCDVSLMLIPNQDDCLYELSVAVKLTLTLE